MPVGIGDEIRAMEVAVELRERGFFIPAIRYPTVARGQARLRVTLSASHRGEDIDELREGISRILNAARKKELTSG